MVETNIVKKEENVLSKLVIETDWTKMLNLVMATAAKGCSKEEFALLCHLAKEYKLNPLKREIWSVKYGGNPANIFVGRDGFLSIAHASGQFNGMETKFTEGTKADGSDTTATCTVYRKDMEHPISVTVRRSEYDTKMSVWKAKPRTMLQKVAEAQALRRAFNVNGVYAPEEFDAVENKKFSTKENEKVIDAETAQ